MTKEKQLAELIDTVEQTMHTLGLWQETPPSEQALNSQQPFAIDTLSPQEWLQWIFLLRIRSLLAQGHSLPSGFSIAPYFEECWKGQSEYQPLLFALRSIDEVCA